MFERESVLTLSDGNEYVVVDKYIDDANTYVYLVDMNKHDNVLFGKLENDEIVEITDPDELEKVIKRVNDNLHN